MFNDILFLHLAEFVAIGYISNFLWVSVRVNINSS